METKMIYLTYQIAKYNSVGERLLETPETVSISYSDYFGKVPAEVIIEKLDVAYNELKRKLVEELEDEE